MQIIRPRTQSSVHLPVHHVQSLTGKETCCFSLKRCCSAAGITVNTPHHHGNKQVHLPGNKKRKHINLYNKWNLRTFKNDPCTAINCRLNIDFFGLACLTYSEVFHQHNQFMKLAWYSNVLLVKRHDKNSLKWEYTQTGKH